MVVIRSLMIFSGRHMAVMSSLRRYSWRLMVVMRSLRIFSCKQYGCNEVSADLFMKAVWL